MCACVYLPARVVQRDRWTWLRKLPVIHWQRDLGLLDIGFWIFLDVKHLLISRCLYIDVVDLGYGDGELLTFEEELNDVRRLMIDLLIHTQWGSNKRSHLRQVNLTVLPNISQTPSLDSRDQAFVARTHVRVQQFCAKAAFPCNFVYLNDFARSFPERVIRSANAPHNLHKASVESDVRQAEIDNKIWERGVLGACSESQWRNKYPPCVRPHRERWQQRQHNKDEDDDPIQSYLSPISSIRLIRAGKISKCAVKATRARAQR